MASYGCTDSWVKKCVAGVVCVCFCLVEAVLLETSDWAADWCCMCVLAPIVVSVSQLDRQLC